MCHMCETEKKKSNAKRSIKWKRWNKRKDNKNQGKETKHIKEQAILIAYNQYGMIKIQYLVVELLIIN